MSEKRCDFCGEVLADWLQEHTIDSCVYYLKDTVAALKKELRVERRKHIITLFEENLITVDQYKEAMADVDALLTEQVA